MRVLLIESVPKLGLPGDVKEVRDGYARNFLFPKKLAIHTRTSEAKKLKDNLTSAREQAIAARKKMAESARSWSDKVVELTAKATSNGTLFGAITDRDIAKNLELDRRQVKIQPVKSVGEYEAVVDLGQGVDARVRVIVKAEAKVK